VRVRLARLAPRAKVPTRIRSLFLPADLELSGLEWNEGELLRAKILCAGAGATLAAVVAAALPIGGIVVVAAAYAGFVGPSLYVERAAARRRSEAERALLTLVEWAEALVTSGRPIETAFVAIAARGIGAALLDRASRAAVRSYALGAPLFPALAREARRAGIPGLAEIAEELERARDLGRGALVVLRDERDRLRAAERARGLTAAGHVEGRLMLVLVLCYLPALMLLVVIPLFLGLLDGLFV
jgi:Flp pilus assembly protein TadB